MPYDQLHCELGPWGDDDPSKTGLILVESRAKASRRPYHKQKLALLLTNMRHFAVEAASRGHRVHYIAGERPYADALRQAHDDLGLSTPITVMRPAEYELRQELAPLIEDAILEEVEHDGWLTSRELFKKSQGKRKSWLMNAFYKRVRSEHDLLMDADGKPQGGKLSFDEDNRKPWDGEPAAPEPLTFKADAITEEVGELIEEFFSTHPGELDLTTIPASRKQAEAMLDWAMKECMEHFGPYEDAMSTRSHTLFHSMLSPLINLHRLTPREVLDRTLDTEMPMQSKEGFVRQLIGWREFMHHVHDTTEGFRQLPKGRTSPDVSDAPGDASWSVYSDRKWSAHQAKGSGGALPNALAAQADVPGAFWGDESGLFCLDHVVEGVMKTGWSHHIERLMVLSNLGTLLDISPRALTDWFWSAYIDAYDWVVEPNVLGMGTFGVGDLFTTKPYISGSNYINKMSNFCSECKLDQKSTCPVTNLYWAFLARHEDTLGDNPRMGLVFANLSRRDDTQLELDAAIFDYVSEALSKGEAITADGLDEVRERFAKG